MPEFRLDAPEPSPEEELAMGPVEAESAAEVLARLERTHRTRVVVEEKEDDDFTPSDTGRTFTLKQMFLVITVIGVWLGILRLLKTYSLAAAAGLTGLVALGALFYAVNHDDAPGYMRLTGWLLLVVYLFASIVALMN